MGYIEKNLVPGETLVYRTTCHWVAMFWPLVGGAVLGFVGFVFFAGGWMAARNGGRYEGAMVWGALALLGAVDANRKVGLGEVFFGVGQTDIGEDIAAAFLDLNSFAHARLTAI